MYLIRKQMQPIKIVKNIHHVIKLLPNIPDSELQTMSVEKLTAQDNNTWNITNQNILNLAQLQQTVNKIEQLALNTQNNAIAIDIETTGFDPKTDEIVQIAIVDEHAQPLFNSLIRPTHATSNAEALKVHGLTPSLLQNQPTLQDVAGQIQTILNQHPIEIGYNQINFDNKFLENAGFKLPQKQIDVMLLYSEYKAVPNNYPEGYNKTPYKWFKLTQCADDFDYPGKYQAHDSLNDAKATMYCFKEIWKYQNLL